MPRPDGELDAVVVGAGWAGLSVSNALQAAGLAHVVLEQHRVCETWRTQRWDSFRMNTPNVQTVMPGECYGGADPQGFMTRDDFVAMLDAYVRRRGLPVKTHTPVSEVRPDARGGFEVVTPVGVLATRNVVVATGNLNRPRRPPIAGSMAHAVTQMDGCDYRAAAPLRPGAVLVVGCGNSGGQIAEDLVRCGRSVYLSTGRNGRIPRRYRGRDIILWLVDTGRMSMPRTSSTGRPLLGADHTISLQSLSAQGIVMLGRLAGATPGGVLLFADDLQDNARFADQVSADIRREIDAYIEQAGLEVPPACDDDAESVAARFPDPPILALDLLARGITTVIWCVGYTGDFGWLRVPGAIDARGAPVQQDCLSVPGVYFAGLDTSASMKSGTILVAEEEATRIADHIGARAARTAAP